VNKVCASGDSTPPVMSGLAPTGTSYDSSAILTVITNEPADCRYGSSDKSFGLMTLNFNSTDNLYHYASASQSKYGVYTYYARCRDISGNVDAASAKITFRYASQAPVATNSSSSVVADRTPPVISAMAPSGRINSARVTVSCVTDEKATCKYDTVDADYASLANTMDSANGGTSQSKAITLPGPGDYTYYVRCKDVFGNKNGKSAKIDFTFARIQAGGPAISSLLPTGSVYQKTLALMVYSDEISDCRWATTDESYDAMTGNFSTQDGHNQQGAVALGDYGQYNYYVRCKDEDGNVDAASSVINFEYKNPDPGSETPVSDSGSRSSTVPNQSNCGKPTLGNSDGTCNNATDCVCDPDCPAAPDSGADPDCVSAGPGSGTKTNGMGLIIMAFLGLLFVVAIIAIGTIIKKRSGADEMQDGESDDNMGQ